MLIQIDIENYASFRDLTRLSLVHAEMAQDDYRMNHVESIITGSLNLPLLNLALIFGANASGKSNLLDALEDVRQMIVEQQSAAIIRPFIFDERTQNAPSYIELTFLLESKIYRYGLVVQDGLVNEEWLVQEMPREQDNEMLFYRQADGALTTHVSWPDSMGITVAADKLYLGALIKIKFEPLIPICQWLTERVFEVKRERMMLLPQIEYRDIFDRYHELFLDLLQLTDSAILDFRANIQTNNFEIKRSYHDLNGECHILPSWLPFDAYVSAGTEHMLALVTLILDAIENDKILIIDEWDTHLHHLVASYLLQYIQESKSQAQFIFSSHDILLLDSEVLHPDQIWFVEKNRDGISSLYSMDEFNQIDEHFKNNQIVRQYLNGRYGAIPFVKPAVPLTNYTDGEMAGEYFE